MAKKRATVSLRKPSPAPEAEARRSRTDTTQVTVLGAEPERAEPEVMSIEAFVNGAAEALERAVGDVPRAKLVELLQRGPAGYRELTVYLPEQLAQDLSLHCLERNLDLNRVVAAALEQHLLGSWTKLDKHRLAAAARALIAELAQRARVLWATRRASWSTAAAAPSASGG